MGEDKECYKTTTAITLRLKSNVKTQVCDEWAGLYVTDFSAALLDSTVC